MSDHSPAHQGTASMEQRVAAIHAAFDERGLTAGNVRQRK